MVWDATVPNVAAAIPNVNAVSRARSIDSLSLFAACDHTLCASQTIRIAVSSDLCVTVGF